MTAIPARRKRGDIGFATLRGGSVVGEHSVLLAGEGEVIELAHRRPTAPSSPAAPSRRRSGRAAQKPGLYAMTDVLGLNQ